MMATQYAPIQINIFTFPGKGLEEAEGVRDAFMAALKERALDELGPLDVQLMGWRGIEGRDVMVEVRQNGDSSLYELVTPDMASRIVQSHLEEHRPVQRWAVGKDFEAYYEGQTVRISELLGRIDPLSLEDYQDYDGYKSLLSFYSQGFDSFLQKVVAAGFCEFSRTRSLPCGTAWCTFRAEKQRPLLVVNAAPPFPSATADMLLLEGCPHQVLEGIILAAKTLPGRGGGGLFAGQRPAGRGAAASSLDQADREPDSAGSHAAETDRHFRRSAVYGGGRRTSSSRPCSLCCPGTFLRNTGVLPFWSIAWAPWRRSPSSLRRRSPSSGNWGSPAPPAP